MRIIIGKNRIISCFLYIRTMVRLSSRKALLSVMSAILFVLALGFVQFYLAWICLVPFFNVLQSCTGKKAFYQGALFGLVFGGLCLYWLPAAVFSLSENALGKSMITGALVFGILSVYYGLIALAFVFLKRKTGALWTNVLLMAALWTVGEYLLSVAFSGMPWFSISIGNTLLGNLYAVQPGEFGGIHLLNFFTVLINYLLAYYITGKQWTKLAVPVALVVAYLGVGYGILYNFKQRLRVSGQPATVALVSGNIPGDVTWNETNGNILATGLLKLNHQALSTRPDLVLWPESVVPWSYCPDDDLIKEILKDTTPYHGTYHIMGISTYLSPNRLYNSAYCLRPDGSIAGRHDKHYLVSMAEQPVTFFSFPFMEEDTSYIYCKAGKEGTTIATPKGKVGILICSELCVGEGARASVKNGAEFLVTLSNNALFGSALGVVHQQFYRNRLRAVEVRKDVAVSCNMGISGMFSATGELTALHWPDGGYTESVTVRPNKLVPVSSYFSALIVYASIFLLLVFLYLSIKKTKR